MKNILIHQFRKTKILRMKINYKQKKPFIILTKTVNYTEKDYKGLIILSLYTSGLS